MHEKGIEAYYTAYTEKYMGIIFLVFRIARMQPSEVGVLMDAQMYACTTTLPHSNWEWESDRAASRNGIVHITNTVRLIPLFLGSRIGIVYLMDDRLVVPETQI